MVGYREAIRHILGLNSAMRGELSSTRRSEQRAEAPAQGSEAVVRAKERAIRHQESAVQSQKVEGIVDPHGDAYCRESPVELESR